MKLACPGIMRIACRQIWIAFFVLTVYACAFNIGCALAVSDQMSRAAALYCGAPLERRILYRSAANAAIDPNEIAIHCSQD